VGLKGAKIVVFFYCSSFVLHGAFSFHFFPGVLPPPVKVMYFIWLSAGAYTVHGTILKHG